MPILRHAPPAKPVMLPRRSRSSPRMCPIVYGAEAIDGDVRVDLRGREGSVTEQLLDDSEVGAPFEQMGRRGMPEPVRSEVGCTGNSRQYVVNDGAGLALVESGAAPTEQQRRTGRGCGQGRSTRVNPHVQRAIGRGTERYDALLVTLAEYAQDQPSPIDIVDVEAAELADSDTGRVEQLDDQPVPHRDGVQLLLSLIHI